MLIISFLFQKWYNKIDILKNKSEPLTCYDDLVRIIMIWCGRQELKQLNKIKNGKKMGKNRQKPPVFFVCPQMRPDAENRAFGSRFGSTP